MLKQRFQKSLLMASLAVACIVSPLAAQANEILARGTFEGRSDHVTTGGITIFETEAGTFVRLESDFFLDSAPDPKLGFGNNGYRTATQFAELEATTGAQVYRVPDHINVNQFNEFWVWCERFSVPLGVARLN